MTTRESLFASENPAWGSTLRGNHGAHLRITILMDIDLSIVTIAELYNAASEMMGVPSDIVMTACF